MTKARGWKQGLATVARLWDAGEYDRALTEVESLIGRWPGNAHLHVLRAGLIQLQDDPKYELDEAKRALTQAVELDGGGPSAAIEFGHYLDAIEDDPRAAVKLYADGVAAARELLIDGLIGQAKAYQQLNKRDEVRACVLEVLHLTRYEPVAKPTRTAEPEADIIFGSAGGVFHVVQMKGPRAEQVQELLGELIGHQSD